MMQSNEIVQLIAALGVGSGASAIATAVVASRSQKGKARAEAADLLIDAAERVGQWNKAQADEIQALRSIVKVMQLTALNYLDGTIDKETFMSAVKEWKV